MVSEEDILAPAARNVIALSSPGGAAKICRWREFSLADQKENRLPNPRLRAPMSRPRRRKRKVKPSRWQMKNLDCSRNSRNERMKKETSKVLECKAEAKIERLRGERERRAVERYVLQISEKERARIGQDLHDGLCQSLAGVACLAEALAKELRCSGLSGVEAALEIANLVRRCGDEARQMAAGMHPVILAMKGIGPALRDLACTVSRQSEVACIVESDPEVHVSDPGTAINLYRIAQEAISNAIKHGNATKVQIRLTAENSKVTLTIRDNGKGFPAKPIRAGMGLHTMRYRATTLGGTLEIRAAGRRGTILNCSFPANGVNEE